MDRRSVVSAAAGLLAGAVAGPFTPAWANAFPNRTMRLIVPFPPGGGTDLVARAVAEKVSSRLGQRMIIDNKSGGMGAIAQRELESSPADGHTLLMDSMAIVVFPHLMKKPLYDPITGLDPVAKISTFPFVIVVHPDVPARNVNELVEYLRTKAGTVNIASAGATTRLAAEMFRLEAGVDMTFIPYRGGAPTMVAMIAGESHVYFGDIPTVLNHVKSGRLRAIAVTSKARSAVLPDIPTVAESGLPKYAFSSWNGLYARAGTPAETLRVLNDAFNHALKEPDVAALIGSSGSVPGEGDVSAFTGFHRSEYAFWKDLVRRAEMPYID